MTADELAEMFVPVPMRWRHIKPGDVIVGDGGRLFMVTDSRAHAGTWRLAIMQAASGYLGDPDDVATVLLPAGLRDAMQLTRDELGAQLLERRGAA